MQTIHLLKNQAHKILCLRYLPKSNLLASSGENSFIYFISMSTLKPCKVFNGGTYTIFALEYLAKKGSFDQKVE